LLKGCLSEAQDPSKCQSLMRELQECVAREKENVSREYKEGKFNKK